MKELMPIDYKKITQSRIEMMKNNSQLSQKQKDAIHRFVRDCYSERLGHARICKYVSTLMKIGIFFKKPFEEILEDDIREFLQWVEFSDYSPWSKRDFRITLKRFWKWLEGTDEYPEIVKWIKTTLDKTKVMKPTELLTEKDIQLLLEVALHPRDRALIALAWETGCRAGELLTLRIRSFKSESEICQLDVMGKTGPRRIPIVASVPHLTKWLSFHPEKDTPDSPLWMSLGPVRKSDYLKYPTFLNLVKKLAKKAGIKKRVYPHLFRHSRATFLANHLTEAQMKHFFGWTQGSDMAATYVHMSGRDIQNSVLSMYGKMSKEDSNKPEITTILCNRCEYENSTISKYCGRCGIPSSEKEILTLNQRLDAYDTLLTTLLNDQNVRNSLDRHMQRKPELIKTVRHLIGPNQQYQSV